MALFGREIALELGRAELVHRAFSKQIRAHPGFRRPKGAVESQQRRPAVSSPNMRMICRSAPLPQSLTMRGGPSNALNWTTMRPFSRTCEIVSMPAELPISFSILHNKELTRAPLPVMSSYQTWFGFAMWNVPRRPLGEMLMCPSALSGAVATQNKCCVLIQSMMMGGICS